LLSSEGKLYAGTVKMTLAASNAKDRAEALRQELESAKNCVGLSAAK
jgi:hypothetical protein